MEESIKRSEEMDITTKDMLKFRGDNVSLYALKMIQDLEKELLKNKK